MIKRVLYFGPLVVFLLLIIGLGYLTWPGRSGPASATPTPEDTPTLPNVTRVTGTPTPRSAPTVTSPLQPETPAVEIVSPSPSPSPVPSVMPTPTRSKPTATSPATPPPSATPTPTPPIVTGTVTAQLHMRQGPGTDYGLVGGVYAGDKVTITGRSPAGDWWQIETSAGKEGWVAAGYVQAIEKLVARLPVITVPRRLLSSTPHPPEPPSSIDVNGASVAGSLSPAGEQQYVFTEKDRETLVILKFRPNVNLNGDPVQFSILYTNQIGQIMNVGSGSRPARDQDGDLNTGELVWRGGSLVPGSEYYLRLVNNSPTPVDYCLDFREDTSWNCR